MKRFQEQTHYEILEVSTSASENEIREAFERALTMYADDSIAVYSLVDPGQADELRNRIKIAGATLLDERSRDDYDRSLGLSPRLRAVSQASVPPSVVERGVGARAGDSTHPDISVAYAGQPAGSLPEVTLTAADEIRASGEHPSPSRAAAGPAAVEPEPHPTPTAPVAAPAAAPDPAAPAATAARPVSPAPAQPRELGSAPLIAEESALATAEAALAQVSARVAQSRPRSLDLAPDAEFNGELLRRVRESRGLSVAQISDRTRITKAHLENVEADHYGQLPAAVYLRGILMSLARELGLDPIRVSKSYLALVQKGKPI